MAPWNGNALASIVISTDIATPKAACTASPALTSVAIAARCRPTNEERSYLHSEKLNPRFWRPAGKHVEMCSCGTCVVLCGKRHVCPQCTTENGPDAQRSGGCAKYFGRFFVGTAPHTPPFAHYDLGTASRCRCAPIASLLRVSRRNGLLH